MCRIIIFRIWIDCASKQFFIVSSTVLSPNSITCVMSWFGASVCAAFRYILPPMSVHATEHSLNWRTFFFFIRFMFWPRGWQTIFQLTTCKIWVVNELIRNRQNWTIHIFSACFSLRPPSAYIMSYRICSTVQIPRIHVRLCVKTFIRPFCFHYSFPIEII